MNMQFYCKKFTLFNFVAMILVNGRHLKYHVRWINNEMKNWKQKDHFNIENNTN